MDRLWRVLALAGTLALVLGASKGNCDPEPEEPVDVCETNGWYGDGVCDEGCLNPDPDCDTPPTDPCEADGRYGDGVCDDDCPSPDPDCETPPVDPCEANGWYGDGVCDEDCPNPDPDCG